MENGKIIKWMVKEHLFGLMEENIMENIKTIKNRDTANTHGQTAVSTRDTGGVASNTDSVATKCLVSRSSSVFGKKASASSGSSRINTTKSWLANLTIKCISERQRVGSMWTSLPLSKFLPSSTSGWPRL